MKSRLGLALLAVFFAAWITIAVAQQEGLVAVLIFRDNDSLTLFLPRASGPVSLQGLRMEVVDTAGNIANFSLDEFPSLRSLQPFTTLPTPLCIRLERDGSNRILPLECNSVTIVTQKLADANVFWHNITTNQGLLVRIVRVSDPLTLCPAEQAVCSFEFEPSDLEGESTPRTNTDNLPSLLGLIDNPVSTNHDWIPYLQTMNGVEMLLVPTGCFTMGSSAGRENEFPPHQQCFTSPYWIDRLEVTNLAYGSHGWWVDDTRPREVVSWYEAKAFCEARGARLLTEVEWEYAARGPDNLRYPWGNQFDANRVIYGHNSSRQSDFVGKREEGGSWVGALDMSGNVWEWVSSIDRPYPYNVSDGRERDDIAEEQRVIRGGSWLNAENVLTTSFRISDLPTFRLNNTGFRCGKSFDPAELDVIAFANRVAAPPTAVRTPTTPMIRTITGVNLRGGPGTNYPVVGSARAYDELLVIAQTTNGNRIWYQVRDLDSQFKWISSEFTEIIDPENTIIPDARTTPAPP